MDTILSIVKWLFIIGVFSTIVQDKTLNTGKKAACCIGCAAVYYYFGTVAFVIAYLIMFFTILDPESNELEDNVEREIVFALQNKKIIKLNDIAATYFKGIGSSAKDSEHNETALKNIQEYGEKCLIKLSNESSTHLVKINTPNGIFYATQETINEIQLFYKMNLLLTGDWNQEIADELLQKFNTEEQYVDNVNNNIRQICNQFKINCKDEYESGISITKVFARDCGIDDVDLMEVYKQIIPTFSYIAFKDLPKYMVRKDMAYKYRCQKCHDVFNKMANYSGTKLCLTCFEEVQEAEKTGEPVILEISPDILQKTEQMSDIFKELNMKELELK